MCIIQIAPLVALRKENITSCKELIYAHSDVHTGSNRGLLEAHRTSPRCGNLVLAPSHTTSGEALVHTPQTIAKRASSNEIFLAKSPLNLGQSIQANKYYGWKEGNIRSLVMWVTCSHIEKKLGLHENSGLTGEW